MKSAYRNFKKCTKQRAGHSLKANSSFYLVFRMGFFGAAHGWGGGEELFAPLSKICHTYPTMTELGTVIPYLRKIQKMFKLRDTFLDSCRYQHFFTGNQQIF